jgi:hypothetical protein
LHHPQTNPTSCAALKNKQIQGKQLQQRIYLPINRLPGDTRLEDLALPFALLARLNLIGVTTLKQFRVLITMQDKTRSQIVTTLRRKPLQKTKRPGLA